MLAITNKNINKKYVIGVSGIIDSAFKFLIKTFTSQGAEELASTAAKEIGKSAATEAGKRIAQKIINPPKNRLRKGWKKS